MCGQRQEAGMSTQAIEQIVKVESWKRARLTRYVRDDELEGRAPNVHMWAVRQLQGLVYMRKEPLEQATAYLGALAYYAGIAAEEIQVRIQSLAAAKSQAAQASLAAPSWSSPPYPASGPSGVGAAPFTQFSVHPPTPGQPGPASGGKVPGLGTCREPEVPGRSSSPEPKSPNTPAEQKDPAFMDFIRRQQEVMAIPARAAVPKRHPRKVSSKYSSSL